MENHILRRLRSFLLLDWLKSPQPSLRQDSPLARRSPDPYVFISYSRADSGLVAQFCTFLSQQELPPWRDNQLDFGESWEEVIVSRIRECAVFVVFMSPSSATSEFVDRELALALAGSKPVVPVLVSGEPFEQLKSKHYYNILDPNRSGGALAERLRDLLGRRQSPSLTLQRQRIERLALRVFQGILASGPSTSLGVGFSEVFNVRLTDSLAELDELEWVEAFMILQELLPTKDFGYDHAVVHGSRFPTIQAFADYLGQQVTWEDIRRL
jgi:TIR domain